MLHNNKEADGKRLSAKKIKLYKNASFRGKGKNNGLYLSMSGYFKTPLSPNEIRIVKCLIIRLSLRAMPKLVTVIIQYAKPAQLEEIQ